MWFVMSRKCSDQFYYAVRIGWKPGIYRGWYGEYGAEKQITGIRNYDYSTGYLKTSSWEDADAYMRAHELFSVESDFTIKKATPFNEDMSVVYGEAHVAAKETPAQNAFFPPSAVEAMLALRTKRKWDEHNADKHPVVTLSTMHSAKGQEYDHVIIIDAVEDRCREIPANRCLSGMPPGKIMRKKNADFSMWQSRVPGMICESW